MTFSQARASIRERLTALDTAKRNLVVCLADAVRMASYEAAAAHVTAVLAIDRELVGIRACVDVLDQVDELRPPDASASLSNYGPGSFNGTG